MAETNATTVTSAGEMSAAYQKALVPFLLQIADDDLIFGHRSAEWLGIAPDLEEDIAFSSISQDEVGHAALFYGLIESITGESADELAFSRPAPERHNARVLEQANGDWAFTITRAYLYNAFEHVRLKGVIASSYLPLQRAAEKILREERYHLLHMETWFGKLAAAQNEARTRLQTALSDIWEGMSDLFSVGSAQAELQAYDILTLSEKELYERWEELVKPVFANADIPWPGDPTSAAHDGRSIRNGRNGQHTEALSELLTIMNEVTASDVHARW